ncbi:hypothetical protein SPRG_13298 [Saprolegnia parasitica CBS 223.65]|uniref:Uncharacterized protein n=1 Tax=Saprolegnia parasitica (strain CBS 223.65) TaxID=695850 RepID=A0A067BTM7_SAPPC|nr:hypothetical protein SPRG_13298 [Saprolegnia parasitica CBS 223.65]KDO21613.1 hypothetical protein SPRG_13298 [Saprolegnia parasitica CBS 223.65]|eukprot:XP_012207699.1 hypothetical protein SPRG_13298 [Saprolegnia parasitica CBS 223.65]
MSAAAKEKGASEYHAQKKMIERLLSSANDGDLAELEVAVNGIVATTGQSLSKGDILSDFKDAHKRSAIHFAALKGRRKVLAYILENSPSSLNLPDEDGRTPLLYAIKANEFATAKSLLVDYKADATLVANNGTSCLHEAAANGSVRAIKLLAEHGAQLEASTPNGTPLHMAVSEDQEKAVESLLSLHANVNARNQHGITPLLLATLMHKPAVAALLLRAGADMTVNIMPGITAVHVAAETGFTSIIEAMLAERAVDTQTIANQRSDAGLTPLELAAGMGHAAVVRLLQPFTAGFESADVDAVLAKEQARVVASEAQTPVVVAPTTATDAEVPATTAAADDEAVVLPPMVAVDDATVAKANVIKDQGNALFVKKQYPESIALYTQALALNPCDALLYSNRCAAHLAAGDAKQALRDVRISLQLKPNWAKALFREGQCLEALKRYEDAAMSMWSAMQLAPEDKLIKKRFQACVQRGRDEHQASLKK